MINPFGIETLMGDNDFERYHWDDERSEYFIDRHRGTFEVISNWMMRQGPLGNEISFILIKNELFEWSISSIPKQSAARSYPHRYISQ